MQVNILNFAKTRPKSKYKINLLSKQIKPKMLNNSLEFVFFVYI